MAFVVVLLLIAAGFLEHILIYHAPALIGRFAFIPAGRDRRLARVSTVRSTKAPPRTTHEPSSNRGDVIWDDGGSLWSGRVRILQGDSRSVYVWSTSGMKPGAVAVVGRVDVHHDGGCLWLRRRYYPHRVVLLVAAIFGPATLALFYPGSWTWGVFLALAMVGLAAATTLAARARIAQAMDSASRELMNRVFE